MKEAIQEKVNYKIGLVLSGGASRGFAHAGALKAMEELGLKPQIISGTSSGAIAAALYAAGKTPNEIYELFKGLRFFSFPRVKFGWKAKTHKPHAEENQKNLLEEKEGKRHAPLMVRNSMFLNTSMLKSLLMNQLGDCTFEELNIPLVVNATNLNTGKTAYFSRGDLIRPVLASSCIPFLFGRVDINGNEYVDGGVMQNLPVRPIRSQCKYVIAVHVNPIEDFSNRKPTQNSIERIYKLLIRGNTMPDREMADILIEPQELVHYGVFDIKKAPRIFRLGYEAARKALDDFIKINPDIITNEAEPIAEAALVY